MNYSRNTDGSVAHVSGTGQRELYHVYDVSGSNLRKTVKLGDNQTTLSQSITNGFDELITEAVASVSGFIYTRSEYNAKGQLTEQYQDAGWNTTPTAATLFEYDTMGNVSKKTLALAEAPDETNSPTEVYAYGAESLEDGIYSVLTRTRFNASGSPLISLQKQMISSLSSSIESKSISVSERNLTSAQWSVYNAATKRTRYTSLPSSDITAEAVTVDGFVVPQSDNAGVTTTAGRTLSVTDAATVNNGTYSYNYDNIGNRNTAQEITEEITNYTANNLNQYTAIGDFAPTYDAAGNQTLVKTTTGIWAVAYDAENRPVSFTNAETNTVIECAYDYMGRRATKKVTVNGSVTLHRRYLYRGYLQIACCDLTRSNHPALWLTTWDPSQPIATRPLAIQKDGTWYTYGWDLTKNICELYGQHGYIRTNYTYTLYGAVSISGDVYQPIQWSSEFHDTELTLVYYNYRHYNPTDGRWLGRDRFEELESINLYRFINNKLYITDYLGDTDFYQTCTNILREEYDNFVLERVEELQNKFNEETWNLVAEDLKNGLTENSRQAQHTWKVIQGLKLS